MALPKKRPTGISVIALLWSISSIVNIGAGLVTISVDMGVYPSLFDPRMPEYFKFLLPMEIMLGFFVVAFGLLTLLVVYGLYTGKEWSYNIALALPIFITIINVASMLLYAFAPSELEMQEAATGAIPFIVMNLVWLLGVWSYLPQSHVKQYLNVIPTPHPTPVPLPPASSALPVPPPPEPATTSEEGKFCRHCGFRNKTDAVFCEKCGRKIG